MKGVGRVDLLDVVHGVDGSLRVSLVRVAHEAEATATAGVAILDDNLCGAVRSDYGGTLSSQGRGHLQPHQPGQTPQTSDGASCRPCAMLGHCAHHKSASIPRRASVWWCLPNEELRHGVNTRNLASLNESLHSKKMKRANDRDRAECVLEVACWLRSD